MIENLEITNLKVFTTQSVSLSPMTLLMGENGAGKSTLVQALLLLAQSAENNAIASLKLNGRYCQIGSGFDAMRQKADVEEIGFNVDGCAMRFAYHQSRDILPIIGDPVPEVFSPNNALRYLSADRIGPRLATPMSRDDTNQCFIDERGENTLAVLSSYGKNLLDKNDHRILGVENTRSILGVTNYFLDKISTGASIEVTNIDSIDSVSCTFGYEGAAGKLPTADLRPTNVGFGLSYALSIIVNCLISKRGDTLIIENPEAHLHTNAQRAICELLARTSKSGVQIICETHSREIFYWLRHFVERYPNYQNDIRLNYVRKIGGSEDSTVDTLFPLNAKTAKLGEAKDQFLEDFGTPTDFIDSVG
jgi:predicted ATPase